MISYLISTDTILKLVALSSLNQHLNSYFKYLFLNNSYITRQRPPGKTRLLLEEVLVRPAGGAHPVVCVGPNTPV